MAVLVDSAAIYRTMTARSSFTLASKIPSPSPAHNGGLEWEDLYQAALDELAKKIPREISREEYDSFVESSRSEDCASETHARDVLEDVLREGPYKGKLHRFFATVRKLFEPLRLFKTGMDTLCQVHSTFCLVWGSVKILIEIAKEVEQVPLIITTGIESLIEFFPLYSKYHEYLSSSVDSGDLPLRRPMVTIYVEYLTFCILARKVARSKVRATIRHAMQEESPFRTCLKTIREQASWIHRFAGVVTLIGVTRMQKDVTVILELMREKSSNYSFSSSSTLPLQHHMVPGLLSPGFVGRESQLQWLEGVLDPENEKLVGTRAGIHGLTGIGKTQLMLKYEATHRGCYTSQLFLVASSQAKFLDSVEQACNSLGLHHQHAHDPKFPNAKVQELHDWLFQNSGWLLLIDNVAYETVDVILELLPSNAEGHTIVTSQYGGAVRKITGLPQVCLALPEMVLDDAVDMFVAAADIDSETMSHKEKVDVVKAMALMPHAIAQAASYIKVNGLEPAVFLTRYNTAPELILGWDDGSGGTVEEEPKGKTQRSSIGMHLGLVFDSLQRTHRDAFLVLKFYSFLEPESIPLFDTWLRPEKAAGFRPEPSPSPPPKRKASTQGCFSVFASCFRDSSPEPDDASPETTLHVSEQLAAIFQNQERRERAIAKLCDLNLTSRIRDGRVLWMHDITHKAVRATTPPQDAPKWTAAGMDIVYHMMPEEDNNAEEHVWVDKCLLAAMALIRKAQSLNTEPREYICLLVLCAVSNLHHGAWSLSREQFEKAKPLYDQNLGPDHPRTIAVLHKLALAARHCGDMAVSEKYCRQAWKLYEGRLGPTAAETLNVLNDLASTIERAGRLKEAEVMFEKLYERERQESGLQGPRTMAAAHNLALCLHNQGRLRDAEVMYRTAVDASEKYLGPGNTGTLKTLGNYAATLDHDGRFAEAQAVYDRALGGFIRVMGFDHLLTLRLRGNMAGLLRQQGNFARAEIMMREVLDTLEKTFGSDSFETIQTLYEMGEVWQAQGDVQKARGAFEDAMGRLSGDMMQHPVVFRFIDSWGAIEREMGHLETAREKSEDAYHRFEDLLGWDDPYTLMAANDYAEVLHAGGQYQEAWDLLVRCRGSFATLLGKEHPHYAMVLNNIGRLCWILKTEEPMPFFKEARTIMAKRVGESHYCTATVSLNVARTVFFAGDTEGALALVAKTQETLEAALTAGHPLTAACDTIMGMMIASRGDQESLVKAQEHFCAATETAQMAEKTMSADYFLNICLLVLVLRQLKGSKPVVGLPDDILESPAAHQPSLCWDIPGVGRLSATQLTGSELKHFSFKSYIPLAIGETIRLRWGRKTCWREAESVRLQE